MEEEHVSETPVFLNVEELINEVVDQDSFFYILNKIWDISVYGKFFSIEVDDHKYLFIKTGNIENYALIKYVKQT